MAGIFNTTEPQRALARNAKGRLARHGYRNVEVRLGDGTLGWPEGGPFDAIIVTAGGPEIPESLRKQLKLGGRLLIPIRSLSDRQRPVKVVREGGPSVLGKGTGAVRVV